MKKRLNIAISILVFFLFAGGIVSSRVLALDVGYGGAVDVRSVDSGTLTLQESEDGLTWTEIIGNLTSGYSMVLDPGNTYEYLDIATITADPALVDGMHAFYFDAFRAPDGFWDYWAVKGVVEGATDWQGVMWSIINGEAPMFYLNAASGVYSLVDGLQYQLDSTMAYLRINGDYPLGTYHFGGWVEDMGGGAEYLNVQITFTKPVEVSINPQDSILGTCEYLDIYLHLDNVHDLYAIDVEMAFDPVVLDAVDLLPGEPGVNFEPVGDWFNAGYWVYNDVNNTTGTIRYSATLTNTTSPVDGSGDIARMRFVSSIFSSSEITFTKVELSDRDGYLIGRPAVEVSGTITVESCAPTDISLSNSTIPENESVGTAIGDFSAIDPDPGDSETYTLVDPVSYPDNAFFSIDGNTLESAIVFDFEARFPSEYTIFVRVTDSGGKYYEEEFVISVTDVNEAPVAVNDTYSLLKNGVLIVPAPGVLSNDIDQDLDLLMAHKVSNPPPGEGSVVMASDGEFSYFPPADWTGSTSFTYYVTDGNLSSNTATVTINVNESNSPPTDINLTPTNLEENLPIGSYVGIFDTVDPDNPDDSFVYTLVSGDGDDDNTQFSISSDMLVSAAVFDFETKNTYSIRVRTTDQGGLWFEESFIISITDANDSPVAYDQSLETNQGTPIEITLAGFDQDGDSFEFVLVGSQAHGTMPWTPPGLIYTPEASFKGVDTFKYRVIDEHGASSNTGTISIKVIGDFCLDVSPQSLSSTLEVGATDNQTLTLTNTCGYDVPFTIDDIGIFIYEQGFEEGLMPPSDGWEMVHNGATLEEWEITSTPDWVYEGTFAAWIYYDDFAPSDEWLLTPMFDTSAFENLDLSFMAYSNTDWVDEATVRVWVTDTNGNPLTAEPIWDQSDELWSAVDYYQVQIDLSAYDSYGPIRIAWQYEGQGGQVFGLDNLRISSHLPSDWLSVDPESSTVPSGGSLDLTVTFDATGLSPDEYLADIYVVNEPSPQLTVPTTLIVQPDLKYYYLPLFAH
jgi:hypothetical protein